MQPIQRGTVLLGEIDHAVAVRPRIWWLGHSGFAVKYFDIVFYLDPALSQNDAPVSPDEVRNADMILCSSAHPGHLDPVSVPAMLAASPASRIVLPKHVAENANKAGIPYQRMTTTDSGLRIEYFKHGVYARVYAVPGARTAVDWNPATGHPTLGYLVRCGDTTFYHAGRCTPFGELADHLRPYNVTVAILPIGTEEGANFTPTEATDLAASIGARWLVPMHFDSEQQVQPFLHHMLFSAPEQRFKVFQPGEGWQIPPPDLE